MPGVQRVGDLMHERPTALLHVDALQLFKHALALRTAVHREGTRKGKKPVLLYLYAEPSTWGDGRPIAQQLHAAHREEVSRLAAMVRGDEVGFAACSYRELTKSWQGSTATSHASAILARFSI
jgi:hypothetical protein